MERIGVDLVGFDWGALAWSTYMYVCIYIYIHTYIQSHTFRGVRLVLCIGFAFSAFEHIL